MWWQQSCSDRSVDVQPTYRLWRVSVGQLWCGTVRVSFVGQDRTNVRLSFGVLGENIAAVIVLIVFLHGQLFTVPAPWRRTTAVGQDYQLVAHCLHCAAQMHGHGCDDMILINVSLIDVEVDIFHHDLWWMMFEWIFLGLSFKLTPWCWSLHQEGHSPHLHWWDQVHYHNTDGQSATALLDIKAERGRNERQQSIRQKNFNSFIHTNNNNNVSLTKHRYGHHFI